MSRSMAERFVPAMRKLGVSEVARSPMGFFNQWGRMGADVWKHEDPKFGQMWRDRRYNFCSRHMEQFRRNPTLRRFLALIAWAYTPFDATKTRRIAEALERDDIGEARMLVKGSKSRSRSRSR